MPDLFLPSRPEKEEVSLVLTDVNRTITEFTEYSFNSHFLTPTDGFSFSVGGDKIPDDLKKALKPGAPVKLVLNGGVQCTGYIDSIEISASRGSGTVYHISGRDGLAQVVDAGADPTTKFKPGQTLEDLVLELFEPFGWDSAKNFAIDAEADRDLRTQEYRAKTKRSDAKGFGRRAIKSYQLHQTKPYPREGVFEFASRVAQRFGLWIWLSADGQQIIVAKPDFAQKPKVKLFRNATGTTNVLEGSVKFDISEQPTAIVADGYSAGGEFARGSPLVILANTALETEGEAPAVLQPYIQAGAKVLSAPTLPASSSMKAPRDRIIFMHDDESQTQEQLENYVRRELALLQRKSLTANYTVEGHGQVVDGSFRPWAVDTTVEVIDDIAGLHETLYVLSRTFNKSRSSGTTTHLELIRLNTLVFSDTGK